MPLHNIKNLKNRRKELRKNSTPEENLLWLKLKGKQTGYKFKRQHSIGYYITDFYCAEKRLIIELDGNQHYENQIQEYDLVRTNDLNNLEYTVLRFSNSEVRNNISDVMLQIKTWLNRASSPVQGED